MRLLVFTPWVPFPITGACQQDRFWGLVQLKKLGYDLHVIGRIHSFQPREEVEAAFANEGIPLTLAPHEEHPWRLLLKNFPKVIANPALLDGASLEYIDPSYLAMVEKVVQEHKPDVVWMDFTSHWPVMRLLKKKYGLPVIMKSQLIEPYSAMAEAGYSLMSALKFPTKYLGEKIATTECDLFLPITHDEDVWYRKHGAKKTMVMPLRGLCKCFVQKKHENTGKPLNAVFLSSSYSMGHNRDAMIFILTKVLPLLRQKAPGQFVFHFTGKKFPKKYEKYLGEDAKVAGFVPDLGAFLGQMDIAVCPWITGYGMQQKVFEPLCRNLPLITNKVAGYPFEDGKEVLLAQTPEHYVEKLLLLRDASVRQGLSEAAYAKAQELFSEEAVMGVMREAIESVKRQYDAL
jgi:hypothetical protein